MASLREAEISFIEVPDSMLAGFRTEGFAKGTWYRLFLADLLPDTERAIWLDADALVLDDIVPLWRTSLEDRYLAAVTNIFQPDHIHRTKKLGIDPRDYFNAGVLVMNLELLRKEEKTKTLRDFAVENAGSLPWYDQDTLNLVLGERRVHLHPRWNLMHSVLRFKSAIDVFGEEDVREARANPAIRHFEGPGPNKPWHALADEADRALYRAHRQNTPWPAVRLQGGGPAARLRAIPQVLRGWR
jgi:lipopolysaccharide biosynthesis glycosyltransferase